MRTIFSALQTGLAGVRYIILSGIFVQVFSVNAFSQLQADFYSDKAGGCSPLTVSFTNNTRGASGSALYAWNLGNGNTSSLKNPGAIYEETGNYTVTLTVTDGNIVSKKTQIITVYKKPTADFKVNAEKVCMPDAALFISTASPGDGYITSYAWDYGDGATQQLGSGQVSHAYSYEQKATVSLTVTNNHGCFNSVIKPEVVEILPSMQAAFTINKTQLCSVAETVPFTNSSTGPGTLSYNWSFGDSKTSTVKQPTHVYASKGIYNVSMTVSNEFGCSASTTRGPVNVAFFNPDFTYNMLCREVNFFSTSYLSPSSSSWNFGDNSSASSMNIAARTYAAPGNYTVKLVNTYGVCKDSVSKVIEVKDQANYNTDFTIPASICRYAEQNFRSSSSVNPSTRLWSIENIYSTSSSSFSYLFSTPGDYNIKLTQTYGTCKEEISKRLKVHPLPSLTGFEAIINGACGSPVSVTYRDTSVASVAWDWNVNYDSYSFNTRANAKSFVYNYTNDGFFSTSLVVTDANGCKSPSISKSLIIQRPVVNIEVIDRRFPGGINNCGTQIVKFGSTGPDLVVSAIWNFGDGTTSTLPEPEHVFDKPGNYNVTLTYTTANGCRGTAESTPITVFETPKADFTSYLVPCHDKIEMVFSPLGGPYKALVWEYGDGNISYSASLPHIYADTGKYMVKLTLFNGSCRESVTKQVYADTLPRFVRITSAERTCLQRGQIIFNQTSMRIEEGSWNFGDGTTLPYDTSNHAVKHTYSRSGRFAVTLSGKSKNCYVSTSSVIPVMQKQNPVLTYTRSPSCSDPSISVNISGLERNEFTILGSSDHQYRQYYVEKFEYSDGVQFNGFFNQSFSYNGYSSVLRGWRAGEPSIRAIIRNPYTDCLDTTNYITIKLPLPRSGFNPQLSAADSSVCINQPVNIFIKGMPVNNRTPSDNYSQQYLQYQVQKFEYEDGSPFTYYVPTGFNYNEYSSSISGLKPGENRIRAIVANVQTGCLDTTSYLPLKVNTISAGFKIITNKVCYKSPLVFEDNSAASADREILSWRWNFGDGITEEKTNATPVSHTYASPGNYNVNLTVTDADGCTASVTAFAPDQAIAAGARPSFTANSPYAPDVPLRTTVSFNNSSSVVATGPVSYLWEFGDGNSVYSYNSAYTFNVAGNYIVKLTVTDQASGCTDSATRLITVRDFNAAFRFSTTLLGANACPPLLVRITNISVGYSRLEWDFGDGSRKETQPNPTHTYFNAGKYKIVLRTYGPNGLTGTYTDSVVITNPSISSMQANMLEGCVSQEISFNASQESTSSYLWDFGDGTLQMADTLNPRHRYSSPGIFLPRLIAKDQTGCAISTALPDKIIIDSVNVSLKNIPRNICESAIAQLKPEVFSIAESLAGRTLSYRWDFGTGDPAHSSTEREPSFAYKDAGDYTIRLLALSPFGCTDEDSLAIVVRGQNSLKITAPEEVNVCLNDKVVIKAEGAYRYEWIDYTDGLSNTGIAAPTVSTITDSRYTVVGHDEYNCSTDTAYINVKLRPLPDVNAGEDVEVLANTEITLAPIVGNDVISFKWTPSDYLTCTDCKTPVLSPKKTTEYILTAKTAYNCEAADQVRVKVLCMDGYIYIPNTFTPNRDNKNDVFYIKGKGVSTVKSLRIYNRWGHLVFEQKNFDINDRSAGWNGIENGRPVPAGAYVYMAEFQCEGESPFIKKGSLMVIY